jgi:aspartyl-tRNA(Asn)/glutamyl-tRNA(Gln) amidotransferase subunit B
MPELPAELKRQLQDQYAFNSEDALFLTDSVEVLTFFNQAVESHHYPEHILNWLKGPVQSVLKDKGLSITGLSLTPGQLGELAELTAGNLSFSVAAQKVLPVLLDEANGTPKQVADRLGLLGEQDKDSLEPLVQEILVAFPDKVKAYKNGKKGLLGFFMGQLMRKTNSTVDPQKASELLTRHLN